MASNPLIHVYTWWGLKAGKKLEEKESTGEGAVVVERTYPYKG